MPAYPLKYKNRTVRLHKATKDCDFDSRTILVEDKWDYVEMWLKRKGVNDALVFWRQAEEFYKASQDLPHTSSPLTNYYSALNATKAFLIAKQVPHSAFHGIDGGSNGAVTTLDNEQIKTAGGGVFSALSSYFGEPTGRGQSFTLKDIFYNLPYIHRAYTVTFDDQDELFIPVSHPTFVRIVENSECYLKLVVHDSIYQDDAAIALFSKYEHDTGVVEEYVVRRKRRFIWSDEDTAEANLARLVTYHDKVRRSMYYIQGPSRLWYLKKEGGSSNRIERCSLTLTLMGLHRVSELARYSPDILSQHFDSEHNWLLSQFIARSLDQYLDEISCEITGQDFMPPGYNNVR